ncbi:MAG TPA: wax ester/triacylglycerol synthase domain-containing protein, partial [Gaiellales bacterium]|nr:wax ester/triacylglycerol synthase domain-containing protein [Gaiellales bacterium]
MPIDRLTAADRVMVWADQVWPQDIAALAILDRTPRMEAVAAAIAARLHLVPRFRQLLDVPPPDLGGPHWTDDPGFDLGHHLHAASLPAPGDEATLLALTAQLMGRRMDRSRPLWEMWFLSGMAGGRAAMYARTHHAIADGIAGIATLASFLDTDREAQPSAPEPWAPAAPPTEDALRADHRRERTDAGRRRLTKLVHPIATARRVLSAAPAFRELVADREISATWLDRRAGLGRRLAL